MKELIEHIAKSLVENPEAVTVQEVANGDLIELRLSVAPDDMGKIIGKQGRIAKAIRVVLKAAAGQGGKRYNLEIG
ncbi:MAG: KH domain-containing protein [Clostridiales bacterium]|jgi:predicted RNA-binding protein YlqC (UPF0109 family)|nr:KH domain-containing protein [Clostridiales bacterium]MDR2712205.1 KH domain-containing protein [Clostridiales bacterium]